MVAEEVIVRSLRDDGNWGARAVGGDTYNRVEFLAQLTAYTHGLTVDDAPNWIEEVAEE